MLDRVLNRPQILGLASELSLTRRLIGPVRRGDRFFYEHVQRAAQLELGFNYCVYSPRNFLFPPRETLFTFERDEKRFITRSVFDDTPTALFGVHPCDVHAVRLLDHVFANRHRDEHYLTRRANLFIVGIDCPQPCTEGVFCRDMHAHEAADGFDLMCYPLQRTVVEEARYGVLFGSKAGRELVLYAQAGEAPTVEDERQLTHYLAAKAGAFPKMIPYDVDTLPDLLDRSYDSLLWEATARRCYSCGSCNLSCPTCYCFNTFDEPNMDLKSGTRVREWDGCQLREFAAVAGGHNFRSKAASRLRHRIYRKAKWIKEREGLAGCVGCARCDRACTAKINSVEIYRQLAEET